MKIRSLGAELSMRTERRTDERTDKHDETHRRFSQFYVQT
jgi:hypothetical protein